MDGEIDKINPICWSRKNDRKGCLDKYLTSSQEFEQLRVDSTGSQSSSNNFADHTKKRNGNFKHFFSQE